MDLIEKVRRARHSFKMISQSETGLRNRYLANLAEVLNDSSETILAANRADYQAASQSGLADAMLDRLALDQLRLDSIIHDVRGLIDLPDPVGEVFDEQVLPNNLKVTKVRVPLGVLAVIYESRPNVTIDTACLAIKSGNCLVMRGGSETIRSNQALVQAIHSALRETGLPEDAVQFIGDPDRLLVHQLLQLDDLIDLVIPRGGAALHTFCRKNSRIPVITGGIGICHLFVDESADLSKSVDVILNAKVQRPTVCNALDTVLVHEAIAPQILPEIIEKLSGAGVKFRIDERSFAFLGKKPQPDVDLAGENDFDTEWLSLVLGIKVVSGTDEAIDHISKHSTGHSDGILTNDPENARTFTQKVDSAAVYVNASTRFTDGTQLGLGTEVAISTQRVHARGPMGLRELTTYKWVIQGDYQIRQ